MTRSCVNAQGTRATRFIVMISSEHGIKSSIVWSLNAAFEGWAVSSVTVAHLGMRFSPFIGHRRAFRMAFGTASVARCSLASLALTAPYGSRAGGMAMAEDMQRWRSVLRFGAGEREANDVDHLSRHKRYGVKMQAF